MATIRRATALLSVAAALAPAAAVAARTLSIPTAKAAAQKVMASDAAHKRATTGGDWITTGPTCSRRAATWVRCHYIVGELPAGKVHPIKCSRVVDVRLRSGKPGPALTKHPLACAS